MLNQKLSCLILSCAITLAACATNPVTGEREFTLVSEEDEIKLGEENYEPLRQAQGGDYVADKALVAYVRKVGKKLAKVSDRKLDYEFSVVNDASINAWALPGGKISINRGLLLALENEAELAAVLGHEIVHAAARHSAQGLTRERLLGLGAVAVNVGAQAGGYGDQADLIGTTAMMAGGLVNLKYGRDAELESDHYGMIYMSRAGYDPRAAISLQQKFVAMSKSGDSDWVSELLASHPPSQERVDKNREMAKQLDKGGKMGRAPYERALAHLKSVAPAYSAHRKGLEAFEKGNMKQAEAAAREAISIEPREGLFHLLLGDVLARQGDKKNARLSYDAAAKLSPDFYAVYEKRGALKKQLGDKRGYRSDMKTAARLLPTAVSYLALGELVEEEGDPQQALQFFKAAASSESATGKAAAQNFARLDRYQNPQKYLEANARLDQQGMLVIVIRNPLEQSIADVRFSLLTGNSKAGKTYRYAEVIEAGASVALATGIGPMNQGKYRSQDYRVLVDQARALPATQ